eukprot:2642690-Ditylum_brightwellii.AAC.1
MNKHSKIPKTPAETRSVLKKNDGDKLSNKQHNKYRMGVGKLLHMTCWSRPEMKNSIKGLNNLEYAKDKTRWSVNGWSVFMFEAPITFKSKMMPIVALSVTEAERFAVVQCTQDMIYAAQ